MKIFVSYSSKDYNEVVKIVESLKKAGHTVWIDQQQLKYGDNIMHSIKQGMEESDIILAFITDNYNNSPNTSAELGAAVLGMSKAKILAVVVGNAKVPFFMSGFMYESFASFDSDMADNIICALNKIEAGEKKQTDISEKIIKDENESKFINQLKNALDSNRLTIVCGAGISASAGIPSWDTLLLSMLNKCINEDRQFDVSDAKKSLPSSSIILGKYLKLMLGNDFERILKESLYDKLGEAETYFGKKTYKETELIYALVKLIRPRRNRGSVESIITFNFDSLIEQTLDKYGIENEAIYSEGMITNNQKIPIYHVHGYLPQNMEIPDSDIVFAEDAYHTQFIDPYSWSNLIQLYKYMNNTCLLIGLSITDPNLRRLLDISRRKNNSNKPRHFVIKRKPELENNFREMQMFLEEQDANSLGLNVFWIDSFDEIPGILDRIRE